MKNTLLLEIVCEELPARFCVPLAQKMRDFFQLQINNNISKYRIKTDDTLKMYSTPRRLAISIPLDGTAYVTQKKSLRGPPLDKCFTDAALPSNALLGFCKRQAIILDSQAVFNLQHDILASYDGTKWDYSGQPIEHSLIVINNDSGRLSIEQSLEYSPSSALEDVVSSLPNLMKELNNTVDRTMRDGDNYRFPRPLQRILAVLDDRAWEIPLSCVAAKSINLDTAMRLDNPMTYGHRDSAGVAIENAVNYSEDMVLSSVIVDREARKQNIIQQLNTCSQALLDKPFSFDKQNKKLLEEVVDLVEFPKVIQCRFPAVYLQLPEQLISCVLVEQQRYFWLGKTGDAHKDCTFFVVTNLSAHCSENQLALNNATVGHQKVVSPRLEDALFYYRADLEKGLEAMAQELNNIVFHNTLGSYAAKNARIFTTAQNISQQMGGIDAETQQLIYLFRADRASQTVNQFTALEGYMLQYFYMSTSEKTKNGALLHLISSGISSELWQDIQMAFNESDMSSYPLQSTALCQVEYRQNWQIFLIDRLDTLVGLIGAGADFSSSRDPFGLRRVIREIAQGLFVLSALAQFGHGKVNLDNYLNNIMIVLQNDNSLQQNIDAATIQEIKTAIISRSFTVWQIEPKISNALGNQINDIGNQIGMIQKAKTLTQMVNQQEFQNLIELYKRSLNIISKNTDKLLTNAELPDQYIASHHEQHFISILAQVEQEITQHIAHSNLETLTNSYRKIEQPLADFFQYVMVIDPNPLICSHRLQLLQKVVDLPAGWINFRALISGDQVS